MVCTHLKYEYTCVIRGWDRSCAASDEWQSRMGIHVLEHGSQQPFYSVIAADYSERYVAQGEANDLLQCDQDLLALGT